MTTLYVAYLHLYVLIEESSAFEKWILQIYDLLIIDFLQSKKGVIRKSLSRHET